MERQDRMHRDKLGPKGVEGPKLKENPRQPEKSQLQFGPKILILPTLSSWGPMHWKNQHLILPLLKRC